MLGFLWLLMRISTSPLRRASPHPAPALHATLGMAVGHPGDVSRGHPEWVAAEGGAGGLNCVCPWDCAVSASQPRAQLLCGATSCHPQHYSPHLARWLLRASSLLKSRGGEKLLLD